MTSKEEKDNKKKSSSLPTWAIVLIVIIAILVVIGAVWKMFMQYKEVSLAATGLGDITQVANKYLDTKAASNALKDAYSR